MAHSTVTSKGQVTIPKSIRDRLRIEPGSRLAFRMEAGTRMIVEVEPGAGAPSLAGALRHLARERPISVEEMKEATRRRAAELHLRSVRHR